MTQAKNYQPQVRDTTNGPNIHTYIPRSDGSVMIGGVIYVPQPASSTFPTTATATATVEPVVIPPGGPAIPAFNVLPAPQYCNPSLQCYPSSSYVLTSQQVPQAPQAPMAYPQPYPQDVYNQAAFPGQQYPQQYPGYQNYTMQPQPSTPGLQTYHISQPAQNTFGLTSGDLLNQQLGTAQGLEMNTKQEMKPTDDDPMRMYYVREFDGSYSQRNRLTIDSGDIGDCRWYAQDGVFYAVRLP